MTLDSAITVIPHAGMFVYPPDRNFLRVPDVASLHGGENVM